MKGSKVKPERRVMTPEDSDLPMLGLSESEAGGNVEHNSNRAAP